MRAAVDGSATPPAVVYTTSTVLPAKRGKRSCSSSTASAESLPGTVKSTSLSPPATPASTDAATSAAIHSTTTRRRRS